MEKTAVGSLRDRCIEESLSIISEDGVSNLSIRKVARRLGVSHGAPYRHFANRDALITEIALKGTQILHEYVSREVDYVNKTPRQNFLQVCQNYIRFAMEQRDYFQLILWTDLPRSTDEYPHLAHEANEIFQIVFRLIRDLKDRLNVPIKDESLAVLHVFSTIHGYASLMSSGKLSVFNYSLEELEQHAEAISKTLFMSYSDATD
jgi:AcrR family transcriptional regulator